MKNRNSRKFAMNLTLIVLFLAGLKLKSPAKTNTNESVERFRQCLGSQPTTLVINDCSMERVRDSENLLKQKISRKELSKWKASRDQICEIAHNRYKNGSIWHQMILGCRHRFNKAFFEELTEYQLRDE